MENLNFIFWNDEWKENTEQKKKQGRGSYGSTCPKKNDSKKSWGQK